MKASRRAFLRSIAVSQEPGSSNPGGKTLVCIFLRGGADTLNMVVPYADDQYYNLRPTLSIAPPTNNSDAGVRLDDFYALHPKLASLFPIFDEGRLAVVQAVGSDNPTGSHFEARIRWITARRMAITSAAVGSDVTCAQGLRVR